MKLTKWTVCAALALAVGFAGAAAAQSPTDMHTGFLNISAGTQTSSRQLTNGAPFTLYGETAKVSGVQRVKGGAMFDIAGGVRVWHQLTLGVALNTMSSHADLDVVGTVPNPLFVNRPRTVTGRATNVSHSETDAHLQASWFVPITNRFDVSVFAGPSFFHVTQDLVSGINLTEGAFPYSQVTATGVTTTAHDGTAVGYNAGLDGTYLLTRKFGVGAFVRYSHASLDLPAVNGTTTLTVGGVQAGVGLHIRF